MAPHLLRGSLGKHRKILMSDKRWGGRLETDCNEPWMPSLIRLSQKAPGGDEMEGKGDPGVGGEVQGTGCSARQSAGGAAFCNQTRELSVLHRVTP